MSLQLSPNDREHFVPALQLEANVYTQENKPWIICFQEEIYNIHVLYVLMYVSVTLAYVPPHFQKLSQNFMASQKY